MTIPNPHADEDLRAQRLYDEEMRATDATSWPAWENLPPLSREAWRQTLRDREGRTQ